MMVQEARAVLKLNPDPEYRVALTHLDGFSHIWVLFVFHQHVAQGWRPTIEPPRLDAPRKVGVFASRSPHRPNAIGMSAVKLEKIDVDAPGGIEIHVSGVDILDGTPILDIKPYLPFADCIQDAHAGWAGSEIPKYPVEFSLESLAQIQTYSRTHGPRLKELIEEMLQWDPRPASQRRGMPIESPATEGMRFGFRILDFDVQWEVRRGALFVRELVALGKT